MPQYKYTAAADVIRPRCPVFKTLKLWAVLILPVVLAGCDGGYETPKIRTPGMESQATTSVINYLAKKNFRLRV